MTLPAARVHEVLARHQLVDGFDQVLDLDRSHGVWLADAITGKEWLDLFSFFASLPLGFNHPGLTDPAFEKAMGRLALHKPTNSDIYTAEMAEFVHTFANTALPPAFRKHLFHIEGGALANENALKAAFDWKVQKNYAKGHRRDVGFKVLHLEWAFHGRTGYTLSLTNTQPIKHVRFPKFDWPRVVNPYCEFPLEGERLAATEARERLALAQIKQAIHEHGDDIAAFMMETIQGEGGDNHFRPEFFKAVRALADEHDFMLIFDEVQTGFGLTGTWWAFEQMGVMPDMFTWGKKTQVCGFASTSRIDEVETNVFTVPSRINSTFGGNLIDMVRCRRFVEIIAEEKLLERVREVGAAFQGHLRELAERFPKLFSNPRGRGLFCAIDLPDAAQAARFRGLLEKEGALALGSGVRTVRFRPALTLTLSEAATARDMLARAAEKMG